MDKLYLTVVALQEFRHSHSRVNSAMVNLAVEFIYDDDNISRLAWEATKRSPNRDLRWKGLANMFAMRSLVLKHDIATMYLDRQRAVMPGMPPIDSILHHCEQHHWWWKAARGTGRGGLPKSKFSY